MEAYGESTMLLSTNPSILLAITRFITTFVNKVVVLLVEKRKRERVSTFMKILVTQTVSCCSYLRFLTFSRHSKEYGIYSELLATS